VDKTGASSKDFWDKVNVILAVAGLVWGISSFCLAGQKAAEAAAAARREEAKRLSGEMAEKLLPVFMKGSDGDRELGLQILETLSPQLARTMADVSSRYRAQSRPQGADSHQRVTGHGLKRTEDSDTHIVRGHDVISDTASLGEDGSALIEAARAFGQRELYAQADRVYLEAARDPAVASKAERQKLAEATALYRADRFYEASQLFQQSFAAVNE
jgi:hypothetical protein